MASIIIRNLENELKERLRMCVAFATRNVGVFAAISLHVIDPWLVD